MNEATPRPWEAVEMDDGYDIEWRGVVIGKIWGHNTKDRGWSNAKYFTTAVNAHDELVAAANLAIRALASAREMLGVFEDNGGHDGLRGEGYRATLDQIDEATALLRTALEKARAP